MARVASIAVETRNPPTNASVSVKPSVVSRTKTNVSLFAVGGE